MVDTSTEAVTKLLDGVTPGHWTGDPRFSTIVAGEKCIAEVFTSDADAHFIAAARDLVPALLAERDEARAEVERLKAQPVTVQDAARVPEVKAMIEAMDFALIRWDEHYEHGYNMQGDWVSDARAALRAIAGGDA